MKDETVVGLHWSFWAIGAVALIWNLMGVANFAVQMSAGALPAYQEAERAIIEGRPVWATGAFALAVIGGALGSLLLLLRKSAAYYVFIASLLGVIVTIIHAIGAVGFDLVGLVPQLMSFLVAAFLIWYAKRAWSQGLLG